MATVTKTVSGSTTTLIVTDQQANATTITVSAGAVTGPTVQFAGAAMARDGVALITELCEQLQTGLVPGAGAQGLNP